MWNCPYPLNRIIVTLAHWFTEITGANRCCMRKGRPFSFEKKKDGALSRPIQFLVPNRQPISTLTPFQTKSELIGLRLESNISKEDRTFTLKIDSNYAY